MRIGIVADDLTGAMDAAVPFADLGMTTVVLLDADAAAGDDAAVLSIDTHTRDASAARAADAARASMRRLKAAGRLPFKKLDSTLRGNVGAEIGAALESSGRRCAIVAPAAPAQGRVLRAGHLFVDGTQVGERDLLDVLRAAMPGCNVRPLRFTEPLLAFSTPCVYVADAECDEDLDRIAALGLARPDEVLLAGSSGLASAIAGRVTHGDKVTDERSRYRHLWFIVGSHNARSAEQVRALLLAHEDVTTIVLPLAEGAAVQRPHRLASLGLVHVEGLGGPALADPLRIAARLAELSVALVGERAEAATALCMTGGDTARAILSRLRVGFVEVTGSAAPGVVHGLVSVDGRRIGIVTKAGGFGQPELFAQLARDLIA